ncbi:MAG: S4 domain-containing protein, partial [Candidatus Omnitrophica bacterium]|nr:S4 domain-containing protein [Candidatus Omnitrophota bacterium]
KKAEQAEIEFDKIFREKEVPTEIPEIEVKDEILDQNGEIEIIDLIYKTNMVSSKSEGKRLIIQKAVKIDKEVILDPFKKIKIKNGMIIKIGKRKFFKLKRE